MVGWEKRGIREVGEEQQERRLREAGSKGGGSRGAGSRGGRAVQEEQQWRREQG